MNKSFATLLIASVLALAISVNTMADWYVGDDYNMHYPQLPDPNGWDVNCSPQDPMLLIADDWECQQSWWISLIHLWVSWRNDDIKIDAINGIYLAIYKNIPADPPERPYSMPGDLVWDRNLSTGEFIINPEPYGEGDQGWFDPWTGIRIFNDHHHFYQINISIPDPFVNAFFAAAGEIYWLAVHIRTAEPNTIGWKTSRSDQWEDAAVFSNVTGGGWVDMRDPETQQPLDLAFVIGYDESLPVTLSTFTAATSGDNVILKWRTETEVDNLGFAIYRSETKDGNYTKIAFVKGAGSTAMPTDYKFVDKKAEVGKTYFYYLEDIDIAGTKNRNDIIKVVVPAKLTQTIPRNLVCFKTSPIHSTLKPGFPMIWQPQRL
jgi:hypothetical protein